MRKRTKNLREKSDKVIERDKKVLTRTLTRETDLVIKQSKGCYVWDQDGKKYLDFAAGIAVSNVGNTNKYVVKAIRKQAGYALHAAFADFYSDIPVRFSELLTSYLPTKLNTVFLSNSGTEAVEAAYKLAKYNTRKKYVMAFNGCFHGRTMGSLSMTNSKEVQRKGFEPFLPVKHVPYCYCYRCPFGKEYPDCNMKCLDNFETVVKKNKKDLAAVFIEMVQGEGGYIVPKKEFIKGVRRVCKENKVLLVDDEIQAGCFRTGTFLASENFGVTADIVCFAKAIAGGLPLGATVFPKELDKWNPGSHANTFGGNLISCAAGLAALKFMKNARLGINADKIGDYLLKRLNELKEEYEIIGDVRGLGLMIGIELVKSKKTKKPAVKEREKVIKNAFEKGLVLLPCGTSTIRFAPPLIVNKALTDQALKIFEDSLKV